MKILLADCETDGLEYTKMHCIASKLYNSPDPPVLYTDMDEWVRMVDKVKPDKFVFHNGLGFDVKAINTLVEPELIDPSKVIDTMVVSKLVNYQKFNTHSLKELGLFLGVHKGDFNGDWSTYTKEMGEYCIQDVIVLESIFNHYKKYIYDSSWAEAMRVEHDMAIICDEMQREGFPFDFDKAVHLLGDIKKEMSELEDGFKRAFGSKLQEVKRIQYRVKASGSLFKNVEEAIAAYPKTVISGNELVCYDYVEFNPASPKQRIEALWEAGWNPVEKTKGHINATKH